MQNRKGFTPLEINNFKRENKKSKSLTGFTIIELIVVIAIIAILAAVVMVNVTQYISKSKDASIQGNLNAAATNAVIYLDPTASSVNVDTSALCITDGPFKTAFFAAGSQQSLCTNGRKSEYCACNGATGATTWVAYVQLNNKGTCTTSAFWCIDSTGAKKMVCTTPGVSATSCTP